MTDDIPAQLALERRVEASRELQRLRLRMSFRRRLALLNEIEAEALREYRERAGRGELIAG